MPSIVECMDDPAIFGAWFDGPSWEAWRAFLAAVWALPPTPKQLAIYQKFTGRREWPKEQADEVALIVGRRGGKALWVETPILCQGDGWKTLADVHPGDYVYGREGQPISVVAESGIQHDRPCFEVLFSDGAKIVADAEHEWVIRDYVGTVETRFLSRGMYIDGGWPISDWPLTRVIERIRACPYSVPVKCIQVDSHDGVYLAGDTLIPTHNSLITSLIACYLALPDYTPYLAPGEVATIPVIAADRKQARTIIRYIKGFFDAVPILKKRELTKQRTKESVTLINRCIIEVHTANFRAVRGYSVPVAIGDEIAFWKSDEASSNPDREVLDGIRPALGTIPNSKLFVLSSPYGRKGVLWEYYDKHYGHEHEQDPILVWKAETLDMHPNFDKKVIKKAYDRDPQVADAEYGANFRKDVESYVSKEIVDLCTVPGRSMLPAMKDVEYSAFVDPSGGSADSFTLGVGHVEESRDSMRAILDYAHEVRPPFSPEEAVKELVGILKQYRVQSVVGDRYAGMWPRERFLAHGIEYEIAPHPKSEIYRNFLPHMNSGDVELLDNRRLRDQLLALERRRGVGGRDIIDHPPRGHDDVVNAAAGVVDIMLGEGYGAQGGVW